MDCQVWICGALNSDLDIFIGTHWRTEVARIINQQILKWKEGVPNITGFCPGLNESPFSGDQEERISLAYITPQQVSAQFLAPIPDVLNRKNGKIGGIVFIQRKLEIRMKVPPSRVTWIVPGLQELELFVPTLVSQLHWSSAGGTAFPVQLTCGLFSSTAG